MSKTHAQLATIDPSIDTLSVLDMNHIRGGMATMDTEKAKKITHNGVRNGWEKNWKGEDYVKEEKIKKVKDSCC